MAQPWRGGVIAQQIVSWRLALLSRAPWGRQHANRWFLMHDYIALSALAIAGYAGASGWLVLLGAVALSIETSWTRVAQLRAQPRVALSSKVVTFLVTGVIAALAYSALAYSAGALIWRLLH